MSTRATRDRSRAMGNEVKDGTAGLGVATAVPDLNTLAEAAAAVADSSSGAVRTRSGRVSKPPVRYEPVEQVEDDYDPGDYDSDESEIQSNDSFGEDDDDEEDDDEDADEDGNLDGFVVPDKSESSESDSDGEPSVPDTKRRSVVVKKRTTPARD